MRYSVIIPVYNAKKTLNRCVDSLLKQNRSDTEIILVNDGSSDNSRAICEEYAKKFDNVKLVSQENAGVSAARNAGLDMACGEYVLFVDSDDYVAEDLFLNIDKVLHDVDVDWLLFSGCVDDGLKKTEIISKPILTKNRKDLLPHIIDSICSKSINGPWAKLYKRELIEKHRIRFPVGVSVAEDRAFNIVYSFYIESFQQSGFVGYVLNTENGDSLSRKRHEDLKQQFAIAESYIDSELNEATISDTEKESYRKAINFGECRGIYHDAKLMLQDHKRWSVRQKELMRLCKTINRKHMKYPKTRYCIMISLPIRLYLTPVIDAIAWKLINA